MSRSNNIEIVPPFKKVFTNNFVKCHKYNPAKGFHKWTLFQTTYTNFQNESTACCSIRGGINVTMSHTNSDHSGKAVENTFSGYTVATTKQNPKLRAVLNWWAQWEILGLFQIVLNLIYCWKSGKIQKSACDRKHQTWFGSTFSHQI